MIKVIVCDHGCEGSRLDGSATPTKRDHKMTPTLSGTLSMKDPILENGFISTKNLKISTSCTQSVSSKGVDQLTPSNDRVFLNFQSCHH